MDELWKMEDFPGRQSNANNFVGNQSDEETRLRTSPARSPSLSELAYS